MNPERLSQHAIYGGTSWLKQKGITARFSAEERMVAKYLPRKQPISLAHILKFEGISTEWMVEVIRHEGFLLPGQNWRKVLRNALTKRLKANRAELDMPGFSEILPLFLEYQAEGGKLKDRDALTLWAKRVLVYPTAETQDRMLAKLVLTVCHESETYALTRSFHWLKMVLATAERFPEMGVAVYKKEDAAMKAAIILELLTD